MMPPARRHRRHALLRLRHRHLPPPQPREAPDELPQRLPAHLPRGEVRQALPHERQGRGVVRKEGVERRGAVPAGEERGEGLLEEGCVWGVEDTERG